MINISLQEILNRYNEDHACVYLCDAIWWIISEREDVDCNVTPQFREEWFKKVHGVFCSGAMYDYGGGYINEWNAIGNYSVGKFNEETCHGYGGKFNTTFGYREYRIWLLESVLRDKGNIVFEFWIETNRYDDN